jgi:hypothetical protein
MTDFGELEFIKEYPTLISGKKPLRLYRTKTTDANGGLVDNYRYHFGFPKEVVELLCPMLETTLYWGERHWKEDGGFWIWWLMIVQEGTDVPVDKLNRELDWRMKYASKCLQWLARAYGKK